MYFIFFKSESFELNNNFEYKCQVYVLDTIGLVRTGMIK